MRRHRQFWGTGSAVLGLRLDFGAFETPSCLVNPTFWSSGTAQKRQKYPDGRVGNVPEGAEPAEMPRRSGVEADCGAFAKIVVFLYTKQGFGGLGHPRNVAVGAPVSRHRQILGTGSAVLNLRLDFEAFETPSCLVNPTSWSSGKTQELQKDPEGRVGNVLEGTKSTETPR